MWFPIHIFYMSFTDYGYIKKQIREAYKEDQIDQGVE